jgi:hypothetical protein
MMSLFAVENLRNSRLWGIARNLVLTHGEYDAKVTGKRVGRRALHPFARKNRKGWATRLGSAALMIGRLGPTNL